MSDGLVSAGKCLFFYWYLGSPWNILITGQFTRFHFWLNTPRVSTVIYVWLYVNWSGEPLRLETYEMCLLRVWSCPQSCDRQLRLQLARRPCGHNGLHLIRFMYSDLVSWISLVVMWMPEYKQGHIAFMPSTKTLSQSDSLQSWMPLDSKITYFLDMAII